ncbi:MAG: 2-isopropylmalate synthase [Chloroflexi bacterium]|nr:2-isopropylmalate synthase [Chloroflexota bacterium]MCL5110216.1 2-isopropylmalate synthase [Chloroflexota bacterium]
MGDRVIIFDTTLRDGEQSPGASLNIEEKLDIARQLARLRVDVIEAGFPITSPGDFAAVRRIAEEIKGPVIAGLARVVAADIDRAWEAVQVAERPRLHVFMSTSDIHLEHQFHRTREEALDICREMVRRAKSYTPDIEFSPMDATRTDPAYLYRVVEAAIDAGATTVNIPDTVGYTTPEEFSALIRGLFENVPNVRRAIISVHCHNDLGMATANSLAAVRCGARQVECTINGIGERAGNAAMEEVVMALQTRFDVYGVATTLDTTQLFKTSRMVSNYTGMSVQPNKAIVGANAFAHESGIHQDGVLKHRTTYEIMDARSVGLADSKLVLGKLSGRHAFRERLAELGYELSADELQQAFAKFKELADRKRDIGDRDLEAIVASEVRRPVEIYHLDQVHFTSGTSSIPTATVKLIDPDGQELIDAAHGDGPIDAIYKAINRLIDVPNVLSEFSVQAVTAGIDAVGEVTVKVRDDGHVFSGRGASTDIVMAAAEAYMNALNKLLAARRATAAAALTPANG